MAKPEASPRLDSCSCHTTTNCPFFSAVTDGSVLSPVLTAVTRNSFSHLVGVAIVLLPFRCAHLRGVAIATAARPRVASGAVLGRLLCAPLGPARRTVRVG